MSDKNEKPHKTFDWFDIQRQYLDALAEFNRSNPFASGPSASSDPFNPFASVGSSTYESFWANVAEAWEKAGGAPDIGDHQKLFGKITEQWRDYYLTGQQFSRLFKGLAGYDDQRGDIADFINRQFEEMGSILTRAKGDFGWAELMEYWEQPMRLMQSFYADIAPYFDKLSQQAGFAAAQKAREELLSMPGLGYSREAQRQYQELMKLWMDCQDHYQEYKVMMMRQGRKALELMREEIIAVYKKSETIDSVQEIYDLWVECNEKVYIECAHTDEYAEFYGRLVNALIAFRKKYQEITEGVLSAMNMPTQSTITALERRQHDTHKQLKSIQLELETLKKQLQETQLELEALKKQLQEADSRGVAKQSKPKSVKKKKVRKTTATGASASTRRKTQNKNRSNN